MTEFLSWSAVLLSTLVQWLLSMEVVPGVSLLGFMAGVFVLGILIRSLIHKA